MSDTLESGCAPHTFTRTWSERTEANFEARRQELGVADELKNIPGVGTLILLALGEQGIKSIEDLAGCTTDDLHGWTEREPRGVTIHRGFLERFQISRGECDAMILHARVKAGWIDETSVAPPSVVPLSGLPI